VDNIVRNLVEVSLRTEDSQAVATNGRISFCRSPTLPVVFLSSLLCSCCKHTARIVKSPAAFDSVGIIFLTCCFLLVGTLVLIAVVMLAIVGFMISCSGHGFTLEYELELIC
jgi:hypothetical protein